MNVRHFHQLVRRDEQVTLSYTFVKTALQRAGLVATRRVRGRHRRRREPRPCFGELLHLDGSPHAWLALCPDQRQTLIATLDDATKRLLYAQLWPAESMAAVMSFVGPSPPHSGRRVTDRQLGPRPGLRGTARTRELAQAVLAAYI